MIYSLVKPIMISLWKHWITNLHMRLFYLTPSLIGSINDKLFRLTNQQVVLMGLLLFRQVETNIFLVCIFINLALLCTCFICAAWNTTAYLCLQFFAKSFCKIFKKKKFLLKLTSGSTRQVLFASRKSYFQSFL